MGFRGYAVIYHSRCLFYFIVYTIFTCLVTHVWVDFRRCTCGHSERAVVEAAGFGCFAPGAFGLGLRR